MFNKPDFLFRKKLSQPFFRFHLLHSIDKANFEISLANPLAISKGCLNIQSSAYESTRNWSPNIIIVYQPTSTAYIYTYVHLSLAEMCHFNKITCNNVSW